MGTVLEAAAWLPFAVGVLCTFAAVGGFLHLLTRHVVRAGEPLRWRAQAAVLAVGLLVVPVATAGYRSPAWHGVGPVRIAEVLFGAFLIGTVTWGVAAWSRSEDRGHGSRERLPGQGSVLQVWLLAALAVGSGTAYLGHGLGLYGVHLAA